MSLSLTQDYELEAETLRSLLDLENGRSSHVSKRARLQSPAAKVREEVSSVGWAFLELPGPLGSTACRPPRCTPNRETWLRALLGANRFSKKRELFSGSSADTPRKTGCRRFLGQSCGFGRLSTPSS